MSVQIKYTDELGSKITAQQQSNLVRYNKLTYVSGELKIIEAIGQGRDANHTTVSYFLDSSEDKNHILQQYNDPNIVACVLHFNKQTENGFSMWDWEQYNKTSILIFKGKKAFTDANRIICHSTFNLVTNELEEGAVKVYYGNQFIDERDDQFLRITYMANGEVDLIFDVNEKFGYIKGISLGQFLADKQFSQQDFPWDEHPYYHSAYPFLPIGNL